MILRIFLLTLACACNIILSTEVNNHIISKVLIASNKEDCIKKISNFDKQIQALLSPAIIVTFDTTKQAQLLYDNLTTLLEVYKNYYQLSHELLDTVYMHLADLSARFLLISRIELSELTEISIPVNNVVSTITPPPLSFPLGTTPDIITTTSKQDDSILISHAFDNILLNNQEKTQTIAYLSIPLLKNLVELKLKKQLSAYLDLVTAVIHQEQQLSNYDVVYHAQMLEFKFLQDILKELFAWLDSQVHIETFEYLRIPGAAFEFKQKVAEIIADSFKSLTEPALFITNPAFLDHHPEIKKRLLSVNLSLFGNIKQGGESTIAYFLFNRSITYIDILKLLENLFTTVGIDARYNNDLNEFYQSSFLNLQQAHDQSGNLLQIFIPKNKVNDYLYLSKRYGIPVTTITIKDKLGKKHNMHSLGAEKYIDIYRNNPLFLDPFTMDAIQARLFLTNTFFLNPTSGIKIYSYNTLSPQAVSQYKIKLKTLINRIMTDWATKKDIMSKKLAIPDQRTFNYTASALAKAAKQLLLQEVTSESKEHAQEVAVRLSTLVEVYGTMYGNPKKLDMMIDLVHDLGAKFSLSQTV